MSAYRGIAARRRALKAYICGGLVIFGSVCMVVGAFAADHVWRTAAVGPDATAAMVALSVLAAVGGLVAFVSVCVGVES